MSDVLAFQSGVIEHQPPVDSQRKGVSSEDPSWGRCSSLLSSSLGIDDSELKGYNSVDELCSGLSQVPIKTDNLG